MRPIKRGCGKRDAGGIYGMCPTSPTGTPVWNFLLDPPLPYREGQFRGIKFAPSEALGDGWGNGSILLIDWIGAEAYPTVASWAEEVRRFGMSRKFPATFPFERLAGKRVWLAVVHKRAIHMWETPVYSGPAYLHCKGGAEGIKEHYPRCVYHSWGTAPRLHEGASPPIHPFIDMGWMGSDFSGPGYWGGFFPWDMVTERAGVDVAQQVHALPQCIFAPGVFGVFPIKHFEAIRYVPDGCKVEKSELEVKIVDD